jgi:hypothetical protein
MGLYDSETLMLFLVKTSLKFVSSKTIIGVSFCPVLPYLRVFQWVFKTRNFNFWDGFQPRKTSIWEGFQTRKSFFERLVFGQTFGPEKSF